MYISLDRTKKRTYARQIYAALRGKILSGELGGGEALPSSRELSRELSVARNTVLTAYDMLAAEGAVSGVAGSGFYVCSGVKRTPESPCPADRQTASLSDVALTEGTINFDSGLPALDLFPREKWNRAVSRAFLDAPVSALGYDDPQGRPEFRSVLCAWLKRTRGVVCGPEQILVTAGAKQGLSLAAKCLLGPESEVWMENPSNENVRRIFSYHTENIVPLEVDGQGIQPERFPREGKPALIFTTPSHQFPMGGILPLQRRMELVAFARRAGAYILEDDYDSAFTYDGPLSNSLFELDGERVIYVGTFSKVMFPSVRLGYLVVPARLIPRMRELKRLADHHSNSVYQLAMMGFMEGGELDRHIRRMKKVYRGRRDRLLALLRDEFGGQARAYGAGAGMHVVAEVAGACFSEARMEALLAAGVYAVPVERHALTKGRHENQIILGYAGLTEEQMAAGLGKIKSVCF